MSAVEQYFAWKLMTMKWAFWVLVALFGFYLLSIVVAIVYFWIEKLIRRLRKLIKANHKESEVK